MDSNDDESKSKPLISSMKPQKEGDESILIKEEDDESKRLLSPQNGEISNEESKTKRKVQWNDKLAEIWVFQPSDVSDSDDDDEADSCFCTIMHQACICVSCLLLRSLSNGFWGHKENVNIHDEVLLKRGRCRTRTFVS